MRRRGKVRGERGEGRTLTERARVREVRHICGPSGHLQLHLRCQLNVPLDILSCASGRVDS